MYNCNSLLICPFYTLRSLYSQTYFKKKKKVTFHLLEIDLEIDLEISALHTFL